MIKQQIDRATESTIDWMTLADRILEGGSVEAHEALAMLQSPDGAIARPAGGGLPRAAAVFRQSRTALFSDECQERPLPGGLRVLLAIEGVATSDIPRYNLMSRPS